MVKRSRRRPLTAESRVRFPMGVPFIDNTTLFEWCCFVSWRVISVCKKSADTKQMT